MSRAKPTPRLYMDGGGVVTGTDDVELARALIVDEYLNEDGDETADPVELWFSVERAHVTRGRIVHCLPGSYGESEGWGWQFHPGEGRGSTPAVEWASR